jgi:glycerophosphoryl diester phosphodiesterase
VELKGRRGDARLASAAATVIRRAGAQARVLVSSFDFRLLAAFRAVAPEVPCGLLFDATHPWRLRVALAARRLRVAALHPETALCTAARLRRWRARGLMVNAWTVDDPAEVARLSGLGATCLITNAPGEVVRQLAQLSRA